MIILNSLPSQYEPFHITTKKRAFSGVVFSGDIDVAANNKGISGDTRLSPLKVGAGIGANIWRQDEK